MRIFLFMLMQSAILVVVGFIGFIVMSAFDIQLDQNSYISMFVGSLIFGFAGSLISLFLSKTMCIKSYGVKLIKTPMNSDEMFIYQTVSNLALKSGLKMPEVGIYNSSDPNAFATGYSKDKALVAVSSGLLRSMGRTEIAAISFGEIIKCTSIKSSAGNVFNEKIVTHMQMHHNLKIGIRTAEEMKVFEGMLKADGYDTSNDFKNK